MAKISKLKKILRHLAFIKKNQCKKKRYLPDRKATSSKSGSVISIRSRRQTLVPP